MKDKLEKHNHSKAYFVFRRFCFLLGILLPISAAIAIPVGISVYNKININETNK